MAEIGLTKPDLLADLKLRIAVDPANTPSPLQKIARARVSHLIEHRREGTAAAPCN